MEEEKADKKKPNKKTKKPRKKQKIEEAEEVEEKEGKLMRGKRKRNNVDEDTIREDVKYFFIKNL
jgi:hypothetical protein